MSTRVICYHQHMFVHAALLWAASFFLRRVESHVDLVHIALVAIFYTSTA